jgi:hypothetical protein
MCNRQDRGEVRMVRDLISLPGTPACPTHPMPGYLRVTTALRYSQRRNGFFISEKWISAGTI